MRLTRHVSNLTCTVGRTDAVVRGEIREKSADGRPDLSLAILATLRRKDRRCCAPLASWCRYLLRLGLVAAAARILPLVFGRGAGVEVSTRG